MSAGDPIKIIYDRVDAFAPQPTPYIALSETVIYEDEIWGSSEEVTLQGQLTGCSFVAIVQAQSDLLAHWSRPFQSMQIWQQTGSLSGLVFQKDLVEVTSISFDQSRWFGVLPYSINLTCYPSGLFSGAFGILSPNDTWSFNEQDNETLAATHTISCRPFNTSSGPSNALTNARNWAFGRSGLQSMVSPIMISGVNANTFCLLTQTETIDRFNGNYALTETYTNDLARTGYGVIRYTTDMQSGNNLISVNVQGTAQGCGRNLTGIRAALANIDMTAVATKQYQGAFGLTDLNPIPLTSSFNENPFTTEIDFNYSFDNSNLPSIWFDYSVDLSVGTNGFITASIEGTVHARGGDLASKLARTMAYASGISLFNLTLPFYNGFDVSSAAAPLNPMPVSNGQTNNQTDGTVELNATFNNRPLTTAILDSFAATVEITPSLAQVDAKPIVDGLGRWSIVNLNYGTRARLSIQGNSVTNVLFSAAAGEAVTKQSIYALFTQYGRFDRATLDQADIVLGRTDQRAISFSYSWSFGPINVVGPTNVSSLSM